MTSAVLVDDQALVRAGLRLILAQDPAVTVVGEAGDGGRRSGSWPGCGRTWS